MKLKLIAAICKRSETIVVIDIPGEDRTITQWLGDGSALYPISALPYLEAESIFTIFDIPEKKRDDYTFKKIVLQPGDNRFDDVVPDEQRVERAHPQIITPKGDIIEPLYTRDGTIFIRQDYLAPIDDLPYYELYERTKKDMPAIAVKTGFLIQAIIYPIDILRDDAFIDQLETLTRKCRIQRTNRLLSESLINQPRHLAQTEIDPETGEITEQEEHQ